MRTILKFLLLILFDIVAAQQNNLKGDWFLDKVTYNDGKPMAINDLMFSDYQEYRIKDNMISINNYTFTCTFTNSTISTNFLKLNYRFSNDYLVISEPGDNKLYYFLKTSDFLKEYPEFEPKKITYDNQEVYVANSIVKPTFDPPIDPKKNDSSLDTFISDHMQSDSQYSGSNYFFKATYILTKDNKITDIKIVNGISKRFDREFQEVLLQAEPYIKNAYGKDLLVEQIISYFQMGNSFKNRQESQLYNLSQKANALFDKNEFKSAITAYNKLLVLNYSEETLNRYGSRVKRALINTGISYLALGDIPNACMAFHKAGDKSNFGVRNYLIAFCE